MSSTLHIFDVSQYIYLDPLGSQVNRGIIQHGEVFEPLTLPCGGLNKLLTTVKMFQSADADLVYCIDSVPTVKRNLHAEVFGNAEGYKGNRPKKPLGVTIQKAMAKEVLDLCGLQTVCYDDYEADDLIASIVHEYRDSYDKIFIHSTDSDLYHLICDNVECVPLLHKGKYVNLSNYVESVNAKYYVQYNTITIHKLCYGEHGDNIPAIDDGMARRITEYISSNDYHLLGDNRFLRELVSKATNDDKRTMAIFDLIAPRIMENIPLYDVSFDSAMFYSFASLFHMYDNARTKYAILPAAYDVVDKYIQMYKE